jgi:hypothetical protein
VGRIHPRGRADSSNFDMSPHPEHDFLPTFG